MNEEAFLQLKFNVLHFFSTLGSDDLNYFIQIANIFRGCEVLGNHPALATVLRHRHQ